MKCESDRGDWKQLPWTRDIQLMVEQHDRRNLEQFLAMGMDVISQELPAPDFSYFKEICF
jgi:hypothetical protein